MLTLNNNLVDRELYPDGRAIIYDLYNESDDPAHTELTLAEAKQLILDWLNAKAKWQAEHGPLHEGVVRESD